MYKGKHTVAPYQDIVIMMISIVLRTGLSRINMCEIISAMQLLACCSIVIVHA
jgi:hypothetical protein